MLDIPFISHFFQLIVYWTYLSDFQKLPRLIICNPLSIQRKFQRISLSELVYRIFQGKTRSKTKISQRTARCHITVLVNLLQLLRANYSAVLWLPLVCSRGAGGLGFNLCCFFVFLIFRLNVPSFLAVILKNFQSLSQLHAQIMGLEYKNMQKLFFKGGVTILKSVKFLAKESKTNMRNIHVRIFYFLFLNVKIRVWVRDWVGFKVRL